MNKTNAFILLFFLQSITYSSTTETVTLSSYTSVDKSPFQFCVMAGPAIAYGELGITVSPELSYNNILYSFLCVVASELNMFGPSPTESTSEFSFLVGKSINFNFGYFSMSAGLSYLNMLRRGDSLPIVNGEHLYTDEYESRYYSKIGFPIKAEAIFKVYYVGVGIQIMLNLNSISPSFGFAPIIYLGTYKKPETKQ